MTKEQSIMILSNFVKDYKNYPGDCHVAIFPDDNGTMLLKSNTQGHITVLYQRDNATYPVTIEEYNDKISMRDFLNRILELLGNNHLNDEEYEEYFQNIHKDAEEDDENDKPDFDELVSSLNPFHCDQDGLRKALDEYFSKQQDEEEEKEKVHIFPVEEERELDDLLYEIVYGWRK